MHRFYLPDASRPGAPLVLQGREAHHAVHVLRVARSERVTILDGIGGEFLCEVTDINHNEVYLRVTQKWTVQPLSRAITLMQAIPKGKAMDTIVQKATELGARRVVPLLSERSTVRLDDEEAAQKREKWQLVAVEAMKQCGAPSLTQVELPMSPRSFLSRAERFDLSLIASLQADSQHPRVIFQEYSAENGQLPLSVAVWVGPEGDFVPSEINAIKSGGALPISLGPQVLRSETAAIYCLSILSYELQPAADPHATSSRAV
jgi:16S rRNA (uracil1498-N3)-methyltransferase